MFVFGTADDVFAMAVRIKENGRALYAGAAKGSEDLVLKKLFEDLEALEDGHIELFKALRRRFSDHLSSGGVWDPEGLAMSYLEAAADTHIFTQEATSERIRQIRTAPQALDMAIQFEKDSLHFFLGLKDMLSDTKEKQELNELVREEKDRIRMLVEAKSTCRPTTCEIIL